MSEIVTLKEHLRRHERLIIVQTLRANRYSRRLTAAALGISPQSLWLRIQRLGITRQEAPVVRSGASFTCLTRDLSPCTVANKKYY